MINRPLRGAAWFLAVAALGWIGARAEAQTADLDVKWQDIQALQKQLSGNAPAGVNEIEYFAPVKARLHQEATEFSEHSGNDPRRFEARLLELKTDVFPADPAERRAIFACHEQLVREILEAPDAPAVIKQNAERTVLFQHLDHLDLIASPDEARSIAGRVDGYLQHYPTDPKSASLQIRRLDLVARYDAALVPSLLEQLATSSDPHVAAAARGRLSQRALAATPLDWKATALDGSGVDFSRLQGRVILVDYWASWCPDCLRALPHVLATYRKFHDRGFEIVGVSVDTDREALANFVKKHGMPWPQLYDGKGWETELATKYGVKGIPEMWLVGADGRVVATGVQAGELDEKVAALLDKDQPPVTTSE